MDRMATSFRIHRWRSSQHKGKKKRGRDPPLVHRRPDKPRCKLDALFGPIPERAGRGGTLIRSSQTNTFPMLEPKLRVDSADHSIISTPFPVPCSPFACAAAAASSPRLPAAWFNLFNVVSPFSPTFTARPSALAVVRLSPQTSDIWGSRGIPWFLTNRPCRGIPSYNNCGQRSSSRCKHLLRLRYTWLGLFLERLAQQPCCLVSWVAAS